MILCKVLGNIVSTLKHPCYEGKKIMLVGPLTLDGKRKGKTFLAVDYAQAGEGDNVLVIKEGSSARLIFDNPEAPVRGIIMGIIDRVDLG